MSAEGRKGWSLALGVLVLAAGLAACSPSSSTSASTSHSTRVSTTTTLPPPATMAVPSTTLTPSPSTTTTAPADAHLTISTTGLSVGELVTVTGTGCPVGYWAEPHLDAGRVVSNELEGPNVPAIFHQGDMEDAEDIFLTETEKSGITVGHEGLWTMNGIVPMVPPGTGVLGETCSPMKDGGVGSPAFYYPTLLVNVTSRYRLAVEPSATVEAGTRLTVTSVGGNCPQPAAAPEVSLYSASDLSLSEGSIPLVGSSAPWKSLLTVPKGLKPGRYRLEADCVEHYAVFGSYTPVVIMVR